MRINLPNQITIARLVLAIIFFVCLSQFDARATQLNLRLLDFCGWLFVVAGLSDILDGYLARKYNQITSFGRVIDPFVDKMLVLGAYIMLTGDNFVDAAGQTITGVSAWMVVVILGRELLVTSLRGVTEAEGRSFAANAYGKAKMFVQSLTVGWILFTLAHPEGVAWAVPFRQPLIYTTVIVTTLSAVPYLSMARGVLSQTSVPSK